MRQNIDFAECLKDSPKFRASLEDTEHDIDLLETKLEKLGKLCALMIDAGKSYSNANTAFIHGVRDVADYFREDDLVTSALGKFTNVLSEIQKYNNILLDQAHRSVCKNLNNFIKTDIRRVKDTRRHFERLSDDLDTALVKHAQSPRPKDGGGGGGGGGDESAADAARNVLTATRAGFRHNLLDYVYQINVLHAKKRFDILGTMLSYMNAQSTFFHQGFDMFADLDPFMKQVAAQLEDLNAKAAAERKEMEDRHAKVQQTPVEAALPDPRDASSAAKMEGYLFKRTTNAFKSWVRRWFEIENNQLVYRKRSKDTVTIMEEDLRFCTVKPAAELDRRYCFEVVSPTRSHLLQADSAAECHAWIAAIQAGVSKAYNNRQASHDDPSDEAAEPVAPPAADVSPSSSDSSIDTPTNTLDAAAAPSPAQPAAAGGSRRSVAGLPHQPPPNGTVGTRKKAWEPKGVSRMKKLLAIPGNSACCDCGAADPRWASINLGITLCIECSGIHRSFGVHLSKVRSLTLDAWEPEQFKVMSELGNATVNRIYLACADESVLRASPHCVRPVREAWIRAKYVDRKFVCRLPRAEGGSPAKLWSVQRRKRRSPSKDKELATPEEEESATSGLLSTSAQIGQGQSQDSGLGGSTPDVIVFGAPAAAAAPAKGGEDEEAGSVSDSSSEEAGSDSEEASDTRSTTSYEDFARLAPDLLLYRAAQARNLGVMLEALAQGASANWANPDDHGRTPLIMATASGSMAPTEFLLLNGAKVDVKDHRGQSPLHHATVLGHTGQVCQFLKRNANQHALDLDGNNPLAIAVQTANADIVTLLRLAKLNEEMRETEGLFGGPDETFNEVFRDFTNMANNTPEKLNRNK